MQTLLSSQTGRTAEPTRQPMLALFARLLALDVMEDTLVSSGRRFYRRAWCPVITLWYLIWQRLQSDPTRQAVVTDARRGGADALRPGGKKPLSQRLPSSRPAGFSNARQRVPLAWVKGCFMSLAQSLSAWAILPQPHALPVRLWDGTTLRLRPRGDLPKQFPPHRTRRQKSYGCVARVGGGSARPAA